MMVLQKEDIENDTLKSLKNFKKRIIDIQKNEFISTFFKMIFLN